jgi:Tol biopolymer transport system component
LQLWAIGADGSGNERLTDNEFSGFAAWSPDGSRIAVNGTPPGATTGQGVFVFDPDRPWNEQEPRRLPPPDSGIGGFTVNDWSPDGTRLAGMTGVSDTGILLHTLETGAYERLTDFGHWPVWLPGGHRLLFVSGGSTFHLVDTRSGEMRRIHSEPYDVLGPPRITADGSEIFYSRRVTEGDIWLATIR